MSLRGDDWEAFSACVLAHVDGYTVAQYGDKGEDLATAYTPEQCVAQIRKYATRFGNNQREGQDALDLLKIAHYAQMAHTLLTVIS